MEMDTMLIVLNQLKSGRVVQMETLIKKSTLSYRGVLNIVNRLRGYDAEIEGVPSTGYKLLNIKDYKEIYKKVSSRKKSKNKKESTSNIKYGAITEDITYNNIKNIMLLRGGIEMERKEAIKVIKRVVNCKSNVDEMEIRTLYEKWRKEVLTD